MTEFQTGLNILLGAFVLVRLVWGIIEIKLKAIDRIRVPKLCIVHLHENKPKKGLISVVSGDNCDVCQTIKKWSKKQ